MLIKPDAIIRGAIVSEDGSKLMLCYSDYDLIVTFDSKTNCILLEESMSRTHGDFNGSEMLKVQTYEPELAHVRLKQLENILYSLTVSVDKTND